MIIMVLCSAMSMGLFAQMENDSIEAFPKADKYTFGDFFDALDLPTVLGVGATPNGIEGATFNSAMRQLPCGQQYVRVQYASWFCRGMLLLLPFVQQ